MPVMVPLGFGVAISALVDNGSLREFVVCAVRPSHSNRCGELPFFRGRFRLWRRGQRVCLWLRCARWCGRCPIMTGVSMFTRWKAFLGFPVSLSGCWSISSNASMSAGTEVQSSLVRGPSWRSFPPLALAWPIAPKPKPRWDAQRHGVNLRSLWVAFSVVWEGLMMGVREIERFLEQWQMEVKDLRRRMILAPTPRERERWYAILLLAQGWTSSATAQALERDPHTIGRWVSAFGKGGPAALIFEQTGGSPPPLTRRSRRS